MRDPGHLDSLLLVAVALAFVGVLACIMMPEAAADFFVVLFEDLQRRAAPEP